MTDVAALAERIREAVNRVISGRPDAVDAAVCTLLAGGHLLLEDVPGVGKTTLAQALARSIDTRATREMNNGAPIEVFVPVEGIGWEVEAAGIVKGTKHPEIARRIADWAASRAANELYAKYFPVVAHPEVKNTPANYPKDIEARMVPMDFEAMAVARDQTLAEWSRRYDGKAAPRP